MKLAQLLSVYPQLKWGSFAHKEVHSLCRDSRKVQSGDLYIAIRGEQKDGHDYLPEVCEKGILGVVVEDDRNIPDHFQGAVVEVSNSRQALDLLASRFYGEPAQNLFCVGVTGTNGKTSTTYMIEAVLNQLGWPTGVMGTINHHLKNRVWESQMTTPDAIDLQRRLKEFSALGAKAVAFEVSSHALAQHRVDSIPFDVAVFTHLTRDHLDYHGTMDNYFQSKQILFSHLLLQSAKKEVFAIINGDDPWSAKLQVADRANVWTYGEEGCGSVRAHFSFEMINKDFNGTHFRLHHPQGVSEVNIPLIGRHNVYNATAAFAVGMAAGATPETCQKGLAQLKAIPGRMEKVVTGNKNFHVFVDYAHTDDALRTVLKLLDEVRKANRLPSQRLSGSRSRIITVFGCGGERDKGKRSLMAQAAQEHSDLVIITSDNPRNEEPEAIIKDIIAGLSASVFKHQVRVEVDRKKAIHLALNEAKKDDVVLIAGKGHENYQIIKDQRLEFSDVEVVREYEK